MMYDLIIRNGTLVDGTGAPGYSADIAISDGRIAAIGAVAGEASRTIDASGLTVTPGFIDHHTHYDAQICWDKLVTPSSWHGVTTVMMGNCGVGIAPCRPEDREIVTWDLVNVEGIPYELLKQGITWEWESFPEFMAAADHRGTGINLAFLAPLTPFRHYVMGSESMDRGANAEETDRIRTLIAEAVDAGAFGFSTSVIGQHIGYGGRPFASRLASRDELKAYCGVIREAGRGGIEIALAESMSVLGDKEYDLLDFLLTESERPVSWIPVMARNDQPEAWRKSLDRSAPLIARGAMAQISSRPMIMDINLRAPAVMAQMESWAPVFNQPVEAQMAIYRDMAFRDTFRKELEQPRIFNGNWEGLEVIHVDDPQLAKYVGRTVADIANERGIDGVDAFLDLAIEDRLGTVYTIEIFNTDPEQVIALLNDERTIIGLSDGGAHVDMLCDAGYATYLLGHWVRECGALTLERGVQRITADIADFWGITTRGRLEVGLAADIAIFDAATVGSAKRATHRNDFPGGAKRLAVNAVGMHYTIVAGEIVFQDQKPTGALPGRVLRSGSC